MTPSHTSAWKEPYLAALIEPDKKKLTKLLRATELAMFLRVQELADSVDGRQERKEIEVASGNLLTLKSLILDWSSPVPCEP